MKLYEITQIYNDTLEDIADQEDLSPEMVEDIMAELSGEFNDKAIATVSFFKNMEADIKAIKEAETAMKTRRTAMENKVKRLKDYLLQNMIRTDINLIECPYFSIRLKNNPPSVAISDENLIPNEFKEIVTSTKIDKMAIKKAGGCPGAELVRGQSLLIK